MSHPSVQAQERPEGRKKRESREKGSTIAVSYGALGTVGVIVENKLCETDVASFVLRRYGMYRRAAKASGLKGGGEEKRCSDTCPQDRARRERGGGASVGLLATPSFAVYGLVPDNDRDRARGGMQEVSDEEGATGEDAPVDMKAEVDWNRQELMVIVPVQSERIRSVRIL